MKTFKVTAIQKAYPHAEMSETVEASSKKEAIAYVKASALSEEFYKKFKAVEV